MNLDKFDFAALVDGTRGSRVLRIIITEALREVLTSNVLSIFHKVIASSQLLPNGT